jgi:ribA/ribD-fused uncharacterized protein
MTQNFVFFFKHTESKGFLSQWYPCHFKDDYGVEYNSAEQYMMYQKAILFQDEKIAQRILQTDQQKDIKSLGRQISRFQQEIWDSHKMIIVLKANIFKFRDNPNLLKKLLHFKNPSFVEASPYDRIWGIGYSETQALDNIQSWGQNLLGKTLDKVYQHFQDYKKTKNEFKGFYSVLSYPPSSEQTK